MNSYFDKLEHPCKLVSGVAAMMAKQFGWSIKWTRIVWLIAAVMNPISIPVIYCILAVILPKLGDQL